VDPSTATVVGCTYSSFTTSRRRSGQRTVRHYINSEVAGLDSSGVLTENGPAHFDQIRIGHYWDQASDASCPGNGGALVYVDDVYIDTSWARVELGNASTYAASTHREIQVARTWADGSVSVNFNPGTFAAGLDGLPVHPRTPITLRRVGSRCKLGRCGSARARTEQRVGALRLRTPLLYR